MLDICLFLSLSLSFFLSFCLSLFLMFSSQRLSSSQTTTGGSFLTCHEWSEGAIFSAKVFFFLRKVGQENEDFFWKYRMTERHRGIEEESCVNKRVSIIFVTFCLFAGQPSLSYTTANMRTNSFLFALSCSFCLHTYITVSTPFNFKIHKHGFHKWIAFT